MAGQFGHQTGGILLVQPPVDASFQSGGWDFPSPVRIAEPMAPHADDLSDQTIPDEPDSLDILLVEHPLHAVVQGFVASQGGFVHLLALFHGEGHRLLAENVFSGIQGVQGHAGMQAEGCGDDDPVDFFVFEQGAVVAVKTGFREECGCLLEMRGIVVAQGDDTGRRDVLEEGQVVLAPGPASDQGDARLLPGRGAPVSTWRAGLEPGGHRQQGCPAGQHPQLFQKVPPSAVLNGLIHTL